MLTGQLRHGSTAKSAIVLIALLLLVFLPRQATATEPLRGVALAIGQNNYLNKDVITSLTDPKSDAREIAKLLIDLGFEARTAFDLTTDQFNDQIDRFVTDAEGADVALLFYSGHGVQASGENYLIPTDADQAGMWDPGADFVSLTPILDRLRAKVPVVILLLDACRNNPYGSAGLAPVNTPQGAANLDMLIGFAAEPGLPAYEDSQSTNSYYTAGILRHFSALESTSLADVMAMVTNEVYLKTKGRQRPWTNLSLRRILYFGAAPVAATGDEALLTGERRKLLLSIAATPQEMRAAVESLARDQSLPLDPLYGMLKELQVDTSAGRDDLDKQLRAGAENLKKLLAEKAAPLRMDPELIRLAGLADRAQAEGAIALAKDYRAKASTRADELDKTLDQREAEVVADRIELASTYADEAGTAILAFDYQLAAAKYAKAHEQVAGKVNALAIKYRLGEADALLNHGDYKGDNESLKQSIVLYEAVLDSTARNESPEDRTAIQNNLGNVLATLGKRERGGENLTKAVAAYEAALTEITRERVPLDWAGTQNNLGNALLSLGNRESGTENLIKAVAAYEAALTEITRERAPLDWAMTQNNFGTALQSLGDRESGTENLAKAVAAYEAALTEMTRERVPLDWAMTQNNLGVALRSLGDRESGTENLVKAVASLEAALTERTRERVPLDWAATQNNLGNALRSLGNRKRGSENLTKAVAAYEAALTEMTRERVPLDWAGTQNNLGSALQALGNRESGTENLTKAVAAYEAALTERTRERVPLEWAGTQNNLGNALQSLGDRESGTENLTKAVAAYEAALTEITRERVPLDWARTQINFGNALQSLGDRESGTENLTKAVTAYEAALTEITRERAPLDWAGTQNNLGNALQSLGDRESGTEDLTKAVAAYEAALTEITRERVPLDWARTQNNLGNTLRSLGNRESGTENLTKAVAAYEAALTGITRERVPLDWAATQYILGGAQLVLGKRLRARSMIEHGRQSVEAAWSVYKSAGYDQYDAGFRERLKEFDTALNALAE